MKPPLIKQICKTAQSKCLIFPYCSYHCWLSRGQIGSDQRDNHDYIIQPWGAEKLLRRILTGITFGKSLSNWVHRHFKVSASYVGGPNFHRISSLLDFLGGLKFQGPATGATGARKQISDNKVRYWRALYPQYPHCMKGEILLVTCFNAAMNTVIQSVDATCVSQAIPEDIEKFQATREPSIKAPYSVFSSLQTKTIVALVCFAGIISPLSSLLYTPAIPAIATDLNTSIQAINLSVTTFLIFQGLTPSLWGTLGDSHGRRPLYIITSLVSAGACIGLSITDSYPALLALRALQAAGSTSTRALGAGVIRDLIPPHLRGGYMGMYSAGVGIGTAFGPLLGGILAQYTGWHGIFYFLLGLSTTSMLSIALFLPETLRYVVGNGSKRPPRYSVPPIRWLCPMFFWSMNDGTALPPKPKVDVLGPLRLLTHVDVLCCVTFTGICYTVWQDSMIATSTLYASQYKLSEAKIGLTYLSNGFGSLIGNVVTGRLLDHDYKKQLTKESTEGSPTPGRVNMIEKARLISLRIDAPIFIIGIIAFGWVVQSRTSIAASITIAFFIGWFDSGILTTYSTLMVDLFENQASASSAIINLVRCLLGAVGTSTVEPMIKKLGVGWSFTLLAGICIVALPLVVMHYYYGHGWRVKRVSKAIWRSPVEDKPDNRLPSPPDQATTYSTYTSTNYRVADAQVLSRLVTHSVGTGVSLQYMLFVLFMDTHKGVFGSNSKYHFYDLPNNIILSEESITRVISEITVNFQSTLDLERLPNDNASETLFSYLDVLGPMTDLEARLTTEWQFVKLDDGLHLRVHFKGDLTKEKVSQLCVQLAEKIQGLSPESTVV